jgi:hypothetical protein
MAGIQISNASEGGSPEPVDDEVVDSSEINWDDLGAEDSEDNESSVEGDLEVVAGGAGDAAGTPSPAVTPAAAAAVEPATQGTTPPVAVTPSLQQPAAAPAVPVAAPVQPTATPESPAAPSPSQEPDYAAWRNEQITALTAGYQLSDEEAAAALTEPEVVIPKLLARAHMQAVESAIRGMQAMLPQMMQAQQQTTSVETRAQEMFFGANSDLKDPALAPAIQECGKLFRKLNPKATPEQAVLGIGNLVRSTMGMPAAAAGQPVAAPAAPVASAAPFAPARGGGGRPLVAQSNSAWEELLGSDDD